MPPPPSISATTALELSSPFGEFNSSLSPSDLRDTAYEIFVASCRATSSRPLTFVSQAQKFDRSTSTSSASPSRERSSIRATTHSAGSAVKKALGLKSSKKDSGLVRSMTVAELMRVQLKVSEAADSRIRRALLRIFAGQVNL